MYTNKKFCTLTGITNETLRHYIKKGLLAPTETLENGYRLYSDLDVLEVLSIRLFRGYDIHISDILPQLSMDFDGYSSWIKEQYSKLKLEIEERQRILDRFEMQIRNHDVILEHPAGEPFHGNGGGEAVLAIYDGTETGARRVESLASDFPHSFPVIQFALDAPPESNAYRIGVGTINDRELPYQENGYTWLSSRRAYMVVNVVDFNTLTRSAFDPLVDHLERHGFTPVGDINCAVIHVSKSGATLSGTISASLCFTV